MDNLSADVKPDEIPEGFTSAGAGTSSTGAAAGGEKQTEAQQRDAQRQAVLEQAMTPEALARLRRVKLVKADKAARVEATITSMAMQGRLPGPINEGKLIEIMEGLDAKQSSAGSGKINIQRKKYAFDSDDDDDNDDDLL